MIHLITVFKRGNIDHYKDWSKRPTEPRMVPPIVIQLTVCTCVENIFHETSGQGDKQILKIPWSNLRSVLVKNIVRENLQKYYVLRRNIKTTVYFHLTTTDQSTSTIFN